VYAKTINNIKILNFKITIPLQAWTGPEVFRRLRLPDFKATLPP